MSRDNAVGFLLLGVCVVVGAILVRAIVIGERPTLSLDPAVTTALGFVFFGLIVYGLVASRRRGGGGDFGSRQWPDPQTGRRSWWDRLRGR